jgi:hypothetical protein
MRSGSSALRDRVSEATRARSDVQDKESLRAEEHSLCWEAGATGERCSQGAVPIAVHINGSTVAALGAT